MRRILSIWAVKLRSTLNDLKRMNREKGLKLTFFSFAGLLFIVFIYYFFLRIIRYLLSPEFGIELVGDVLIIQLLTMINLTLFSVLVFSNIIASLSTLYMSKDLDLLLSSPVKHSEVYTAKFFQSLVNSSYMVLVFGLPIYFALGRAFGEGMRYYLVMLSMFVPFVVIPASLGILITMLLMRFFPAKRTYQIFTFLGMIFAAGLIIFFRFLKPETLYKDITNTTQPVFLELLEAMKVPQYRFLPPTWFTRAINDMVGIEQNVFWTNFSLLFLGAVVSFIVVFLISRLIYFSGFSQAFESKKRGRQTEIVSLSVFDRSFRYFDGPQRAVLIKDLKTFFRDPTQWSQIFLLASLIFIYLFSIYNIPVDTPFLKNLTSFLNLGLAGFIISALAVRFVFPTTSLEGDAYWVVFSSPLSVRKFLWGKFIVFLVPILFLGELLIVSSNFILNADYFFMMLSSITMLIIAVTLTGMGVGLGAIYPRFKHENSTEIAGSFGGIIYMILSLLYIGVTVVILSRPVYFYFVNKVVPGSYRLLSLVISILLFLLISSVAFFIPMWRGIKNLETMEF